MSGAAFHRPSGARHSTDVGIVLALVVLTIGPPAAAAAAAGALWIPHNDSWAHSRIAATLAETGTLQLIGFNRAAMVGMMAPLGPLGASIVAQHLFVMACGSAVVGFSYGLARQFLGRWPAALVAATVGAAPGFALLSTSYMTDVPMMAGISAALYFGSRFISAGRPLHLALAAGFGLWGVTVREQALAALVAVLAAGLAYRRDRRATSALISFLALTLVVVFEVWRRSQAGDDPPQLGLGLGYALRGTAMGVMTLLFVSSPVLLGTLRRAGGKTRILMGAAAALAGGALLGLLGPGMLLGNYFTPDGAYLAMFYGTRETLPQAYFWGAGLLAVVALVALALRTSDVLLLSRRVGRGRMACGHGQTALLVLFIALYLGGTFLQTLSGQGIFERYFYPVIAPLAIMALRGVRLDRVRTLLAVSALAFVSLGSAAIALHTWTSTGAAWRAAESLVAEGMDPRDVDAGFAWVGYHSSSAVAPQPARDEAIGSWTLFEDSRQCALVSLATPTGETSDVTSVPYSRYLVVGRDQVLIERLPACR